MAALSAPSFHGCVTSRHNNITAVERKKNRCALLRAPKRQIPQNPFGINGVRVVLGVTSY